MWSKRNNSVSFLMTQSLPRLHIQFARVKRISHNLPVFQVYFQYLPIAFKKSFYIFLSSAIAQFSHVNSRHFPGVAARRGESATTYARFKVRVPHVVFSKIKVPALVVIVKIPNSFFFFFPVLRRLASSFLVHYRPLCSGVWIRSPNSCLEALILSLTNFNS